MAGLQKKIHAKRIWCEQQSELALSRCSSAEDIFMDIFFHKYIYRGLEPSDKCSAKQTNKKKRHRAAQRRPRRWPANILMVFKCGVQ